MQFTTSRFGTQDVADERVLHFPLGLLGFETVQRYVLIDSDEVTPLRWLQAVDRPELAFLVVEPHLFFPDYRVTPSADDREVLGLPAGEEPLVACLVVIPDDPSQMTINLMGPLVFNPDQRLGKQLVLHDASYSARQRLLPDPAAPEQPALV